VPILTAEERLGTVLGGRYSLDSILGTGGTSIVYAATHTFTKRAVALKILKPEHANNRELVARFLREARIASTLVHPHVVAILDMGTEDGDTYLAMELLGGEALSQLAAREAPMGVDRTLTLLRPLMEAVALAHSRGVVHRDLKPDNILVGDRGDGTTRAILLDFGMAKTAEVAWGHMTQSGILVGTPFYMSPEQAEGADDIDAATDVWAMGVTLYRCLSGELPFYATAPSALLLAIARGDHVPLGTRRPELPAPIAAWVEGALALDRTQRYRDMSEMLAALDRALAGEILPAPVDEAAPALEVASTPPARSGSRWIAVGVAGMVALALAALAWGRPQTQPVSPAPVAHETIVPPAPMVAATIVAPSFVSPPPTTVAEAAPVVPDAPVPPRGPHRARAVGAPPATTPLPPPTRSSSGLASEW
jgi:serine/threonine protein kinase